MPELDYDKWYEDNGEELWRAYYEEGANYDQNYEDWCEKQYEDAVYCNTCKYKQCPHEGGWCYMYKYYSISYSHIAFHTILHSPGHSWRLVHGRLPIILLGFFHTIRRSLVQALFTSRDLC